MRYAIVTITCFVLSWGFWAIAAVVSNDPFDDDLVPWILANTLIPGTVCGAALAISILPCVYIASRPKPSTLNLCPRCCYDLRATPHECPECGWKRADKRTQGG